MTAKKEPVETNPEEEESTIILCNCLQDAFAALPPELRPKLESWKSKMRHVRCTVCEKMFWTNREEDLCSDCLHTNLKPDQTDLQP